MATVSMFLVKRTLPGGGLSATYPRGSVSMASALPSSHEAS